MPGRSRSRGWHGLAQRLIATLGRSSRYGQVQAALLIGILAASLATAPTVTEAASADGATRTYGAPAEATCTNRPRVEIVSVKQSGGLAVTITSNTSAVAPNNRLLLLRVGAMPDAAMDVRGQTLLTNGFLFLPDRPQSVSVFLRRTNGSGAITVPMVVTDDCGDWSTFLGGGSTVFNQSDPNPPPTPTIGVCGESMTAWHGPLVTTSAVTNCQAGHEHGDAPPSWVTNAGYTVSFAGSFNTSPQENSYKHPGMKGFLTSLKGVEIYFRPHVTSNVLDRSARFHSYQVWARDGSGGVSHWQGWSNSGDPVTDRITRTVPEPQRRPLMLVVDQASWDLGFRCEQWYQITSLWSWDFGWTICDINALYYPGENSQLDQSFWRIPPGNGHVGGTRRLEAAWYQDADRPHPVGEFWATQFGDIVNGPSDSRCSGSTVRYNVQYANVCLRQFIASTMTEVSYPNNAVQKQYSTTGVRSPN